MTNASQPPQPPAGPATPPTTPLPSDPPAAIGVGMIGCGTVGSGVAKLLQQHAKLYAQRTGRPFQLRRVLVRDAARPRDHVDPDLITDDPEAFFATPEMSVVIEVAGGLEPTSDYVRRAILTGRHVVTANKALLASEGVELFTLAQDHGVSIAFEASCGGGMPIVTALTFGLMANRIQAMYGILNGTCNYILTEMTRAGKTYETALAEAQDLGFAEADPTMDVSGRDAGQKLAILASLAFGVRVPEEGVALRGIAGLDVADLRYGRELGYELKLLAVAERGAFLVHQPESGSSEHQDASGLVLRVMPCFVRQDEPLASVHGSFNALSVYGEAVGHTLYYGRGAGQMPTASAVVGDLLNTVSGWYPRAFASMDLWDRGHEPLTSVDPTRLYRRYYLRVSALDVPGTMGRITNALGQHGISISAVIQHEADAGRFVPVVITTHAAPEAAIQQALQAIQALDAIDGEPVCLPVLDLPNG